MHDPRLIDPVLAAWCAQLRSTLHTPFANAADGMGMVEPASSSSGMASLPALAASGAPNGLPARSLTRRRIEIEAAPLTHGHRHRCRSFL